MKDGVNGEVNIKPTISFTRDYLRDFVPGRAVAQSLGFRVDQSQLAHNYKLRPAVQSQLPDLKKFEKNLSDYGRSEVERMRKTGNYNHGLSVNGVALSDLAQGTAAQKNRWESEERVVAPEITNFKDYITGIVIPGQWTENKDLIKFLTTSSRTVDMYKFRNLVLDSAIKLGVPIIWQRQEYDPQEVKNQVIKYYQDRKRAA